MKSGEEDLKGVFLAPGRSMETGVVRTGPNGTDSKDGKEGKTSPPPPFSGSNPMRAVHYNPYPNGNSQVSILGEALEQAETLRKELNRVHAGLSLLSHSLDRLGDVVAVNSKW